MSQITDICTEVIKKTGVITEAMFQNICEVAKAPDINIGYAADTINSIYMVILKKAWQVHTMHSESLLQ